MYILHKTHGILNYVFDSRCWTACLSVLWLTHTYTQRGLFSHSSCGKIMLVSNPVEWPPAIQAYLIFLIPRRLWDCVETALHPWSYITCSCISSFQFQSNFGWTFDLMWTKSSLGQPKGVRPVCGYQASRAWKDIYYLWTWKHVEFSYTRTKGYALGPIQVDYLMLNQSWPRITTFLLCCSLFLSTFKVYCGGVTQSCAGDIKVCWRGNKKERRVGCVATGACKTWNLIQEVHFE